jgi:hypothetical protein
MMACTCGPSYRRGFRLEDHGLRLSQGEKMRPYLKKKEKPNKRKIKVKNGQGACLTR